MVKVLPPELVSQARAFGISQIALKVTPRPSMFIRSIGRRSCMGCVTWHPPGGQVDAELDRVWYYLPTWDTLYVQDDEDD